MPPFDFGCGPSWTSSKVTESGAALSSQGEASSGVSEPALIDACKLSSLGSDSAPKSLLGAYWVHRILMLLGT